MIQLYEYLLSFQSDAQVVQLDLISGWSYQGLQLNQLPASATISLSSSSFRVQLPAPGQLEGNLLLAEDRSIGNPLMLTTTRQQGNHLSLREPLQTSTFIGTGINDRFTAPQDQLNLLMALSQPGRGLSRPGPDELKPEANPRYFETRIDIVLEDALNLDWKVPDALLLFDFQQSSFESSLSALQLMPHQLQFTGQLRAVLSLTVLCPQANLNIQASLGNGRARLRTALDEVVLEPGSTQAQTLTLRSET